MNAHKHNYALMHRWYTWGGYSLGNLLCMCSPRREHPLWQTTKKTPIIGAKLAENPPIMDKNWVILKENGHFLPQVEIKFPKKVPMIGAGMPPKSTHDRCKLFQKPPSVNTRIMGVPPPPPGCYRCHL